MYFFANSDGHWKLREIGRDVSFNASRAISLSRGKKFLAQIRMNIYRTLTCSFLRADGDLSTAVYAPAAIKARCINGPCKQQHYTRIVISEIIRAFKT